MVLFCALLVGTSLALCGCFDSTTGPSGPITGYDGPRPIFDSSVDGWFSYAGDGRFKNPDGTPMEIPASVKDHMHSLGIDRQLTIPLC
jgi:hypothetical protein